MGVWPFEDLVGTFGTVPAKLNTPSLDWLPRKLKLQTAGGPWERTLPNVSLPGEMRQQVLSNLDPGVLLLGDVCTTARVAGVEMNAIW